MARIRTIKPEFPQSESMGRVSRDARLLFILLWTMVDDAGRARADSRMLARILYPYDDGEDGAEKTSRADIEGWLVELETEECVVRYSVDGNSYLQVNNWLTHQKIDKPSKSKFPEFDEESRRLAKAREGSRSIVVGSGSGSGREGKGEDLPVAQERDAGPVERIFAHWQSEFQHPRAQMDAKRRRVIAAALRSYDEATVCAAISGYRHSPHHMGQNERRTVYDDIELFLRDSTHIESGLNFGRAQATRQSWPVKFHQEVVAAYHELLPDLPAVRDWTEQRRRLLDERIAERVKAGKNADQISYWRAMFGQVQQSDFLRGRADDWRCPGLEWMLDPENFLKVIEGAYNGSKRLNGTGHAR